MSQLHEQIADTYVNAYVNARKSGASHALAKQAGLESAAARYPQVEAWRTEYAASISDRKTGPRENGAKDFNTFMGMVGPRLKALRNSERRLKRASVLADKLEDWIDGYGQDAELPHEDFVAFVTGIDYQVVRDAYNLITENGYTITPVLTETNEVIRYDAASPEDVAADADIDALQSEIDTLISDVNALMSEIKERFAQENGAPGRRAVVIS